ncbi:MAG: pirin family protein [Bacteroidales bacterium]|nr:pirin family protein [Bacteroidales bacterium]
MKSILHKANVRGKADYGWLKANYSFSFGNFYDSSRIHFGMLRVLNDDLIATGMGFDTHPHDNMEIISIPLKGVLEHKDDMGHISQISINDVQVMSAGTGITHSEYNPSAKEAVNLLQIWISPQKRNVEPRYDQKKFNSEERINRFQTLVSPFENNGNLWINQKSWISIISFDSLKKIDYCVHNKGNGIYFFVIDGTIDIENIPLTNRDGLGLWEIDRIGLKSKEKAELLIIEVPMF